MKHCPFCGGEAELKVLNSRYVESSTTLLSDFQVKCKNCGVRTPIFKCETQVVNGEIIYENGALEAIRVWEARVNWDDEMEDGHKD